MRLVISRENASVLISISALILSFVTSTVNITSSNSHEISDKEIRLATETDLIESLQYGLINKSNNPPSVTPSDTYRRIKTHLAYATTLSKDLGRRVDSYELISLAQSSLLMNNISEARRFYKQAIKNSSNDWDKVRVLRFYAIFSSQRPNPLEPDLSNTLFSQAENMIPTLSGTPWEIHAEQVALSQGWAESLAPANCPAALMHFTKAWSIEREFGSPGDQFWPAINSQIASGLTPNCKPLLAELVGR